MAQNAALAQAMARYSPQVQTEAQRSQYLTDALAALQQSPEPIRGGWGELAAKLAGVALLNRAQGKAQTQLATTMKGEKDARLARLMAGLPGADTQMAGVTPPPQPPAQPPMPAPVAQAAPPPPVAQAPQPAPAAAAAPVGDLAWQANVKQESGGNGNAIGPMTDYGQALGSTQMLPATAKAMADKLGLPWRPDWLVGNTPEELDYQNKLGRAYFAEGLQKYGGDPRKAAMYYHGGPDERLWGPKTQAHADKVMANLAKAQGAAAPSDSVGPGDFAFQLLTGGAGADSITPSAPGSSPPAVGAPPAAPPQAAAGGNPTTYQPTGEEVNYIRTLLQSGDPSQEALGEELALKLRYKMTQPVEMQTQMVNGVPAWLDPTRPGQMTIGAIPQAAQSRVVSAAEAGISAPPGTMVEIAPNGSMKVVDKPQGGQQVVSAPGQQYREQAIPGGTGDLKTPANIAEGANRYNTMAKTIVDAATRVRQNYGAVQTGYKQQNGTGDIAMVNGLQRLIDEGVVRGEDVNMQMKSNGLEGTVGSMLQYLSSGGLLTPDVRDKLYRTASALYDNADRTYKARVMSMAPGFDELYGQGAFGKFVMPQAFVDELGWGPNGRQPMQGAPAGEAAQTPVPEAALKAWRAAATNPKAPVGDEFHPFLARDAATLQGLDRPENRGKWVIGPDGRKGQIQ